MTPEEKINKLEKIINDENYKGNKALYIHALNQIKKNYKIVSTDSYRIKDCYKGNGDVREQKKRYREKYSEYEKSWGGRYDKYEC